MRILFLSAWYPFLPNNGSKLRIYNLLRGLAQNHDVSLITFYDPKQDKLIDQRHQNLFKEVQSLPVKTYNARSRRAMAGFFSPRPRVLVDRHDPEMEARVAEAAGSGKYNLVIASQWYTAAYAHAFQGLPAIFEEAEFGVFKDKILQASNPLLQFRHSLTNLKMKSYFRQLLKNFGAATVVSHQERRLMKEVLPEYNHVEVIPNCVNSADYIPFQQKPEPNTLIFTGSFRYAPNYDAMHWFLDKVYPRVVESVPGVRLTITGDPAGKHLQQTGNVTVTGHVKDLYPLVASSWASLAPIRTGGGTRLKILESLALRTPVIATTKGAEGLELNNEEHLLIANTPDEYADAVIRLLTEPGLRRRLADNGYQLVRERYDWPVVLPEFLNLTERVAYRRLGARQIPVSQTTL